MEILQDADPTSQLKSPAGNLEIFTSVFVEW